MCVSDPRRLGWVGVRGRGSEDEQGRQGRQGRQGSRGGRGQGEQGGQGRQGRHLGGETQLPQQHLQVLARGAADRGAVGCGVQRGRGGGHESSGGGEGLVVKRRVDVHLQGRAGRAGPGEGRPGAGAAGAAGCAWEAAGVERVHGKGGNRVAVAVIAGVVGGRRGICRR